MSATTETLLAQIAELEVLLVKKPQDATLKEQLLNLQKQLSGANEALTEGKSTLLKG